MNVYYQVKVKVKVKIKVQCTLVQALRLCTGRTARSEIRGIALPFHDHSTRRRWGVRVTPRPLFTPGKDPVPIVKIKYTLVQALRRCTGSTARRGSRGTAVPFLDHGTRRVEGSGSRPGRSLPPGKTRYPL